MDYCKLVLIGHLGQDPTLKTLPSGDPVCNFSVAYSEKRKDGEQETQWFNAQVFGKLAEACHKFLSKGRPVYLEGTLRTRCYSDKTGAPRVSMDVLVSTVRFLGSSESPKASLEETVSDVLKGSAFDMDSIPF